MFTDTYYFKISFTVDLEMQLKAVAHILYQQQFYLVVDSDSTNKVKCLLSERLYVCYVDTIRGWHLVLHVK